MALGDLTININSDNSRAKKGLDDLREHAKGFMYSISKFGGVGSGPAALLGLSGPAAMAAEVGATVGVAIAAFKSLADVKKQAAATDISVEGYFKLQEAIKGTSAELEPMLEAVRKASYNTIEAYNGNEDLAKSFQRLGLNVSNLMSMNTEDRFMAIAKAIKETKNSSDAMALSMKVLGEEAGKNLPAIQNVVDAKPSNVEARKAAVELSSDIGKGSKGMWNTLTESLTAFVGKIELARRAVILYNEEIAAASINSNMFGNVDMDPKVFLNNDRLKENLQTLIAAYKMGVIEYNEFRRRISEPIPFDRITIDSLAKKHDNGPRLSENQAIVKFLEDYAKAVGDVGTEEERRIAQAHELAKAYVRLGLTSAENFKQKKKEIFAEMEFYREKEKQAKLDEERYAKRQAFYDQMSKSMEEGKFEVEVKAGALTEVEAKVLKVKRDMENLGFDPSVIESVSSEYEKQLKALEDITKQSKSEQESLDKFREKQKLEAEKEKAIKEGLLAVDKEIVDTKLEEAVLQGRITEQQVQAYRAMRGLMDKGMSAKDAEQAVMPLFGKLNSLKQEKINQEIIKGVAEVKEETQKLEADKEKRILEIKREAMVKSGQMTEEQAKLEAEMAEWVEKKWGKMDKATQDMLLNIYKSEKDTGVSKARGDMSTISDSMLRYGAYMGRTTLGGNDPAVASLKKIEAYNAKMVSWASRFSLGLRSN